MFPINLSGFKPSVDSVSIIGFYLKNIRLFHFQMVFIYYFNLLTRSIISKIS